MQIKYPFAHLVKQEMEASVVMFEMDDTIYCWDDIPANCPRWSFDSFGDYDNHKEEAIDRVKEMVEKEDWELLETTEESLESLISK